MDGKRGASLSLVMPKQIKNRCEWCGSDPLYVQYHDREWGAPCMTIAGFSSSWFSRRASGAELG